MPNATTRYDSVAALFHNESNAKTAINNLKAEGFTESEISAATAAGYDEDYSQEHRGFWDRIRETFGQHEHNESKGQFQGSLETKGVGPSRAHYLNTALDKGDILIVVHTDGDRAREAREIIERAGGDIQAGSSALATDESGGSGVKDERRIRLLREVLHVDKERVQRGEVRLRKDVVTEQQNVQVPVSREELVVERVPVQNREAGAQEIGSADKEIRVPLSEERVRVEKKPVVNEEVRVGKKQVQDTKQVSDSVRHEELRTENSEDLNAPKKKRTA
jgi:uncharacterized protein (TIGR02271 family)